MQKYYIIRPDGSSIFALPYPEDFCYHCLCFLQNDGIRYLLLSADTLSSNVVQTLSRTRAGCISLWRSEK